jgi:hypothetical protein
MPDTAKSIWSVPHTAGHGIKDGVKHRFLICETHRGFELFRFRGEVLLADHNGSKKDN